MWYEHPTLFSSQGVEAYISGNAFYCLTLDVPIEESGECAPRSAPHLSLKSAAMKQVLKVYMNSLQQASICCKISTQIWPVYTGIQYVDWHLGAGIKCLCQSHSVPYARQDRPQTEWIQLLQIEPSVMIWARAFPLLGSSLTLSNVFDLIMQVSTVSHNAAKNFWIRIVTLA